MSNRTVFITGAARGIGAATAERLHARGDNVALVGLEPERLEELAARLGDRAAFFEADVTDRDALDAAVEGTVERFGGIDVAIANAGIHSTGSLLGADPARIERTLEVNLFGVLRTDLAVLPQIVQRKGYLLNIASLAAASHAPLMGPYTASKAGVEALTDALRVELSTPARAPAAPTSASSTPTSCARRSPSPRRRRCRSNMPGVHPQAGAGRQGRRRDRARRRQAAGQRRGRRASSAASSRCAASCSR